MADDPFVRGIIIKIVVVIEMIQSYMNEQNSGVVMLDTKRDHFIGDNINKYQWCILILLLLMLDLGVTTMPTDAMAPKVASTSTGMVLAV